jgi:hypothetical protein
MCVCLSNIEFKFYTGTSHVALSEALFVEGVSGVPVTVAALGLVRLRYHALFLFSVSVWAHPHVTNYSNSLQLL